MFKLNERTSKERNFSQTAAFACFPFFLSCQLWMLLAYLFRTCNMYKLRVKNCAFRLHLIHVQIWEGASAAFEIHTICFSRFKMIMILNPPLTLRFSLKLQRKLFTSSCFLLKQTFLETFLPFLLLFLLKFSSS